MIRLFTIEGRCSIACLFPSIISFAILSWFSCFNLFFLHLLKFWQIRIVAPFLDDRGECTILI